ncbi:type II secretion system protein [Methylophilus sp. Leaf414]|uniref:type II secretion system protein n=1 Tax=Methylophilus sp. Leaf414 TaxID=1736371 RepID=UPI0006F410F6|nr:type II secretion system protein [Methylophilus sp. Leaf414]KQT33932.1 general secretion pathway protein GspG [Methylophilus sp. Leaf414]
MWCQSTARVCRARRLTHGNGFTLIELMVSLTIVAIMASVATPMVQLTLQRQKEQQLRESLREIRRAIDGYKKAADDGRIKKNADATGYPPNLQILAEGVQDMKDPKRKVLRFLRRVPQDPMLRVQQTAGTSPSVGWGLRSYDSPPESPRYSQDVYDVYSLSTQTGINGVPYAQW